MPPKEKIRFEDLGLSTPLPDVLARSREARQHAQVTQKKEKKARAASAMAELAASRAAVEAHKQYVREAATRAARAKAERKRELRAAHAQAQQAREQQAQQAAVASVQSQQRVVEQMRAERRDAAAVARQVQALLEAETQMRAKQAPRSAHVVIHRSAAIASERADLPVLREEQPIVEAVTTCDRTCVLICGETGSGKTTQVPQFLWEAGYGHAAGAAFGREGGILVTEPRRVAAVSMARRVAEELNVGFGAEVGYHVRYSNNITPRCRLRFCTEGIVLKEIQSDFLLRKYSVIIVDEAHERSVSCDLLIGLLSRIVPLRNDLFREQLRAHDGDVTKTTVKPLRLVIMSATMRVADFRDNTTLFPRTPPLISVEARRFPVANHFARKTELCKYVDEAFNKVRQIHRKLPPGGILVFLCTQREIDELCGRLRRYYGKTRVEYYSDRYDKHALLTGQSKEERQCASSSERDEADTAAPRDEYDLTVDDYELVDNDQAQHGSSSADRHGRDGLLMSKQRRGETGKVTRRESEGITGFSSSSNSDNDSDALADVSEVNGELNTMHVLPLYALLDAAQQQRVFQPPPRGRRLCVVATNVAETSITIPNIRYVVDAGRVKAKVTDPATHASRFRIEWTSQASAEQRSGRAGRMGPGHCYRLYSTAVYANSMSPHGVPEILRSPLDSVVLLMKHIGITHVGGFPFPSPPQETDLKAALQHLAVIGALDPRDGYKITLLGRQLVQYPTPPRFARAIVEVMRTALVNHDSHLLEHVLAIVSVVTTTSDVFTTAGKQMRGARQVTGDDSAMPAAPRDGDYDAAARRAAVQSLVHPGSDLITYLNAFHAYLRHGRPGCRRFCLVQKSMEEAKMLYNQLRRLVHAAGTDGDDIVDTLDLNETWSETRDAGAAPRTEGGRGSDDDAGVTGCIDADEERAIRRAFIPGLKDQVARRATVHECRALGVTFTATRTSKTPYLVTSTRSIAFVHPTSAVARTFPPPEYVTFCFLQRVVRSATKEAQTTMLGVTAVTQEWLRQCDFSEEAAPSPSVC